MPAVPLPRRRSRPHRTGPTVAVVVGALLAAAAVTTACDPGEDPPTRSAFADSQRPYAASAHGGNYMHNFYFPPAPSSTPWYPAWAPDGQSIAVGMSGSIWSVDPATGVATELVRSEDYLSSPNWSPDGRWLVYTADAGGGPIQLEVLDTSTGETRRLTDDDEIHVDPRFSPDGTRLAYVSTRPSGFFNIYIREIADGQWAGDEVAITYDSTFGRSRLYFGAWDMHISPSWLPSGDELLIVSNRDVPLGSGNVYRIPARENGIDSRVAVLEEQTLYRTQPDVSLDGRRFVYSSTAGAADQFNNLYVQPTVGGEPYKLTFFEYDAFQPALVAGRRVDRLHQQQGRTAPARTARDLRRGSTHRHHRRASLEGADGHPHDDHPGRGRRADWHPHPPHGLGRQALYARGRVLAHQPGGRPHLPPRRILPGRTAPRQRAHDRSCAASSMCPRNSTSASSRAKTSA